MIKIKHFLLLAILSVIVYACGDNGGTSTVDNFDHEAQAIIDNDSLVKFLKNHYYDTTIDSVKLITNGETSLFEDTKLKIQDVTETINEIDIDYKLYYYEVTAGIISKGKPTIVDSVFVNYSGQRIVNTDSISNTFDSNKTIWFTLGGAIVNGRLSSVISGWTYGITNFSPGNNITNNGPITYENQGKGILFIPSGLAYRNSGTPSILPNEPLMFYIDLLDYVEDTDGDSDGVSSILEDLDGDGNPWNDDTDDDNIANFLDADDDGDGVLTRDEDANGDGDPRNDFSDPNNPTLPDYLNRNIR